MPTPISTTLADRLKGKYQTTHDGHMLWTAGRSSQGKYPVMSTPGKARKPMYVHAALWTEQNGEVPNTPCPDGSDQWQLHHFCRYGHNCINPNCIELVTRRQHAALHKFDRNWKKSLNRIAPYGYIPASFAQVAA